MTRPILVMGCFPIYLLIVSILTTDKHQGLLGPLRKLGLKESAYWLSILVTCVILSFASAVISLAGKAIGGLSYPLLSKTDYLTFFLMQFLFGVAFPLFGCIFVSAVSRPYASFIMTGFILTVVALLAFVWTVIGTVSTGFYHSAYKSIDFGLIICSLMPFYHYGFLLFSLD